MFVYFKIAIIFSFLWSHTLLYASNNNRKYDIRSAMVEYSISGGGMLTPESNLTLEGKAKLYFEEWGKIEIFEEEVKEITSGAIRNIEKTHSLKKTVEDKIFDVDFKNKKILVHQIVKESEHITEDLVYSGQSKIIKYPCEMWEGDGIRKCIYKGIPLLIEYHMLGISYQKKAVGLFIDENSSLSLPNYPVQQFSLFKSNIKTKSKKLPKEFLPRFIELSTKLKKMLKDKNIKQKDLSLKKRKIWLEKLGGNIFQKQKKLLPEFLLSMKQTRVCLQQATNWIEANSCLESLKTLKKEFMQNRENSIESWKGEEKQNILNEFDHNIALLESKMKCIRSAKNMTDLSSCMK